MTAPLHEGLNLYEPVYFLQTIFDRPIDELMIIFVAIVEFLVCLPMPWIRSPFLRKVHATGWGIAIGFYAYGVSFWVYVVFVLNGWLAMTLLPRKWSPQAIIGSSFAYLFAVHNYYYFLD